MFKTIRRIIGVLFIAAALILTAIPAQKLEAASYAKEEFLMDNDTLSKYTGTDTSVSVSDDVKYIGEEAFASNQYIENVKLGKNVKEIRHGAFANCTYLSKMMLPDSVEKIESAAFSSCTGLMNVTLGKNVETIEPAAFAGCSNLTSVSIPKGNGNFITESGTLYDNKKEHIYTYLNGNGYDTYKMPNSVKNIDMYSFWGNEDLRDVYLSGNLESIPGYAFSNCKNLAYIQIPYSVNSIDAKAFENCVSLREVTIPPSVTYINPTAFDGCTNLTIIAQPGSAADTFNNSFDRSDIAASEIQDAKQLVKNVGKGTSGYVSNVSDGNGSTASAVGSYVTSDGLINAQNDPSNVEWMPSVNSLSSPEDSSVLGKTIVVSGNAVFFINREMTVRELDASDITPVPAADGSVTQEDGGTVIYDSGKGGYLPKYTEANGRIACMAYYADRELEELQLPTSVNAIGRFAFARSNARKITIPEGVTDIGYGAFYHCDNLSEINVPSSVKNIEAYAFDNTAFLNNFKSDVSNPFLILGDGLLVAYSGNEANAVIPEGVKKVCPGCFSYNTSIESVYLPNSLNEIGSDAFRECSNLTTVSGGKNVEKIDDRAFMGCPIGTFYVGGKVKSMGLRSVDFSGTSKTDSSKTVVFEGNSLPAISYDSSSSRLSNIDYRKDVLYNCLFAIVDDSINDYTNTVLDGNRLGFSGLVLSIEKDENGAETGNAVVKANYIFSDEVIESLPDYVSVKGTNYKIKDADKLQAVERIREEGRSAKEVYTLHNGQEDDGYSAYFSEEEFTGILRINDSEAAKSALNAAYSELFGNETVDMQAYDISLSDPADTVQIDRFGKSILYITIPVDIKAKKYHVVTLDEDGQLEELNAGYDENGKCLTIQAQHLSYIGIYGIDDENITLNMKDGRLVKNYRLDASPETGDHTASIKVVGCIALLSVGILLLLIKPKKRQRV